jgi:hypothetical protein
MLASGRLPPFPGGLCGPTGFLQRISTSGYPILSFLSGFILTLYAGFELELAGAGALTALDRLSCLISGNDGLFMGTLHPKWYRFEVSNDID